MQEIIENLKFEDWSFTPRSDYSNFFCFYEIDIFTQSNYSKIATLL